MKNPLLLLLAALLIIHSSNAQNVVSEFDEKHSIEEVKSDFEILKFNLEKVHTGLYTYTDKNKMNQSFDSVRATINRPLSSIEFYRQVSVLNSIIKNGHTAILPPLNYDKALQQNLPRFPFDVYWDNNSLYVLRNNSTNDDILEGSRIKSINGEASEVVFNYLVSNWTRDGYNKTKPEAEISDMFDFFYAYFIGTTPSYSLEIVSKEGNTNSYNVKGLTREEISKNRTKRYGSEGQKSMEIGEPALVFAIQNNIGIMTIKDFATSYYKSTGQDYKRFFRKSFENLQSSNAKSLILDLRNNTGGHTEPVAELLSYLLDKPFTVYKSITSTSGKFPNPKLYTKKTWWWNSFSFLWLKKEGDTYHFSRGEYGLKPTQPSSPHFTGKVYVLINPYSFSATGEAASLIKDSQIGATFIGEEAGGNANQNTSGFTRILELPTTGLRIVIPTELFELNVNSINRGHGVIPDYKIRPTIDDLLNKKDVALEVALKLIKEESQR